MRVVGLRTFGPLLFLRIKVKGKRIKVKEKKFDWAKCPWKTI
jgi:hypothetical protein